MIDVLGFYFLVFFVFLPDLAFIQSLWLLDTVLTYPTIAFLEKCLSLKKVTVSILRKPNLCCEVRVHGKEKSLSYTCR